MSKVQKSGERYLWKQEDKARAVAAVGAVGNVIKAAALIGIPENTIRYWMKQEWWEEEMRRCERSDTDELKSTYTRIAKRAANLLEDRLENGDAVVTKDGALVQRPIPGKELAIIAAVATDKRKQAMETPATIALQSSTERLSQLVENFIRYANAKQIDGGEAQEIKDA
jgi:transposase-like protein